MIGNQTILDCPAVFVTTRTFDDVITVNVKIQLGYERFSAGMTMEVCSLNAAALYWAVSAKRLHFYMPFSDVPDYTSCKHAFRS